MRGCFIAGTDTGVGKTRVTAGLITVLRERGLSAAGMKPVVCGLINDNGRYFSEDVDNICIASGQKADGRDVNPYAFPEPISPNIAAKKHQTSIDIAVIKRHFSSICENSDFPVVEGTGGWLAPISEEQTMADIAVALGLPVILVVGLRLGCLNHALLTAQAMHASGLPLAGWIGSRVAEDFDEAEGNIHTLTIRLGAPPLALLPHSHSARSALPSLREAASRLLGDPGTQRGS